MLTRFGALLILGSIVIYAFLAIQTFKQAPKVQVEYDYENVVQP